MASYILDTDILTLWQRGHAKVTFEVSQRPPGDVAITIISVEEQVLGRISSLRQAKKMVDRMARAYLNFTETVRWFRKVEVLTFSEPSIHRYNHLLGLKLKVGKPDLRIAAIALEVGATVVTKNRIDFGRIPGLAIVDWSV